MIKILGILGFGDENNESFVYRLRNTSLSETRLSKIDNFIMHSPIVALVENS